MRYATRSCNLRDYLGREFDLIVVGQDSFSFCEMGRRSVFGLCLYREPRKIAISGSVGGDSSHAPLRDDGSGLSSGSYIFSLERVSGDQRVVGIARKHDLSSNGLGEGERVSLEVRDLFKGCFPGEICDGRFLGKVA